MYFEQLEHNHECMSLSFQYLLGVTIHQEKNEMVICRNFNVDINIMGIMNRIFPFCYSSGYLIQL